MRKQADAQENERTRFESNRLKLNGELELRRRELQQEWQELGLSQQHWHEAINIEQAAEERRANALAAREMAAAQAEQVLAEEKQHWEREREARRQELDGLDNRIRHLRSQLPPAPLISAATGRPAQPQLLAGPESAADLYIAWRMRLPISAGDWRSNGSICWRSMTGGTRKRWTLPARWKRRPCNSLKGNTNSKPENGSLKNISPKRAGNKRC